MLQSEIFASIMADRRYGFNTDFLFQCLDQRGYLFFATWRHPDSHRTRRCIHCGNHGNSVIGFKNKFQKGDPATINPIILSNGFQFQDRIPLQKNLFSFQSGRERKFHKRHMLFDSASYRLISREQAYNTISCNSTFPRNLFLFNR